tara:strand:- start:12599 stop:13330 length:732 start_codon:yes stop_codon:yes gene_type:complete
MINGGKRYYKESKMGKNHLKTLAAPKTWPLKRRLRKYVLRPYPGPHNLRFSMPLNVILRDLINISENTKETKKILFSKNVLVDGKRRKEVKFPVGIFDCISIKETNQNFRIILNEKGKLDFIEIKDEENSIKPSKIIGKTMMKNSKIQLNLNDGKNITLDKGDQKVGDTLILSLPDWNISKHLKLEKNAIVFFTGGKHIGSTGTVEEIRGSKIIYKNKEGDMVETLKKHAFVIGAGKAEISLE